MSVDVLVPWRDSGCEWRAQGWAWVQQRFAMHHPSWRIVTGDSDPAKDFVIGAALNDAIAKASADVVIITSADGVIASSVLRHAAIHAETEPWVMVSNAYIRLDQPTTERVLAMPPDTPDVPTRDGGTRAMTQLGWGVLAMRRSQLIDNGIIYDERLTAAWEDSQIGAACGLLLGDPLRMRAPVVLLWHPPAHRAHHPDFPNGGDLYAQYRRAYFGKNVSAMRTLLAEGRLSCQTSG